MIPRRRLPGDNFFQEKSATMFGFWFEVALLTGASAASGVASDCRADSDTVQRAAGGFSA